MTRRVAPEFIGSTTSSMCVSRSGRSLASQFTVSTAPGWENAFYPAGTKAAQYLDFYSREFDTVEVDSRFYAIPSLGTVRAWYNKTSPNFVFALKAPQLISHKKLLFDCEAELKQFLFAADTLGEKLGPILFQFGYFNRSAIKFQGQFLARLKPFLAKLPTGYKFAVEIRNKKWVNTRFLDVLRERGIAFALIDHSWVPRPWEYNLWLDFVTADFAYVRLLGDRKAIEQRTKVWDKVIVNRSREIKSWVDYLRPMKLRGETIYVYVNNHYSGFGPATAAEFAKLWKQANE